MIMQQNLSCGIRVIAERMQSVRSCAIGVWIATGSVRENDEQRGASHFIEHMLFKGTDRRTAKEIAAEMDSVGGNINAFTSKECTCYYAKVLDEHLETAVDILSDILRHSKFDEEEIEKEKGVVCEEILMTEDSPEDVAHDTLTSLFFGGDPLALPILGTKESVTGFSRDILLNYLGRHYTPDNIVISLAGNLPEFDTIIPLLEKYFSGHTSAPKVEPMAASKAAGGRLFKAVKKDIEQIHISMGMPGIALDADGQYPLFVLSNALGGSMSSRLFQKVREQRGLAYSIYSYPSCYSSIGYFGVYAGTGEKQADEVIKLILEELDNIKNKGLTDDEFYRCRNQLKGSYLMSKEGTSSRMNALGKSLLLLNKQYDEEETLRRIEAITPESVRDVIDRLVDVTNLSSVCVGRVEDKEDKLRELCLPS